MSEDRSFYVTPDVGKRQNVLSEYHVYRTGKDNGDCLKLSKQESRLAKM